MNEQKEKQREDKKKEHLDKYIFENINEQNKIK